MEHRSSNHPTRSTMNRPLPMILALAGLVAFLAADSVRAQQPPITLAGHKNAASAAGFTPDGKLIVTGSFDKTLKIWDAATGAELRTLEGHAGQVLTLAISPSGRQIASGSRDNSVKLWQTFIPTPCDS